MNAIQYIKANGINSARDVVNGAPDKTATHYVFRKIPNYYSVDFQSWFYDGEWWDSDCHTEQDLIDSYGDKFVVNLSYLKGLVESVDRVNEHYTLERAKQYAESPYTAPEVKAVLLQDIAHYEEIYNESTT